MVRSTTKTPTQFILVGDSDIERWPKSLLPFGEEAGPRLKYIVSGHSGATLSQILPAVETALTSSRTGSTTWNADDPIYAVVCAGENDLGGGVPLEETGKALNLLLSLVESQRARLVFLGPKLEPWLADDRASRRQYIRLSQYMEKCCAEHPHASQICFVDCLTMFCGMTARLPGALRGGNAKADSRFFECDQLHLSNEGYMIWKEKVEESIVSLMP